MSLHISLLLEVVTCDPCLFDFTKSSAGLPHIVSVFCFSVPAADDWVLMGNGSVKVESKMIGQIVTAVFAILLVLGLVANFLVVYVTIVTKRAAKHPIHSIFVLNLAISDVIFLVISAPYWVRSKYSLVNKRILLCTY